MKKKKIKLCLTKQLLNMFKLWCEWGTRIYSRPWLFEGQITLSTAMINLYPADDATRFAITYPLDSDLSVGYIALSILYTTGPRSFMVT